MWAFIVGGSKGGREVPPSSPFEPMANGMHGNVDVGHCIVVVDLLGVLVLGKLIIVGVAQDSLLIVISYLVYNFSSAPKPNTQRICWSSWTCRICRKGT